MSDQKDEDMKLIEHHAAILSEHFDTVEIITTRHQPNTGDKDENGTVMCNSGTGNYFARYGSVKEWLLRNDERSRLIIQKEEKD